MCSKLEAKQFATQDIDPCQKIFEDMENIVHYACISVIKCTCAEEFQWGWFVRLSDYILNYCIDKCIVFNNDNLFIFCVNMKCIIKLF